MFQCIRKTFTTQKKIERYLYVAHVAVGQTWTIVCTLFKFMRNHPLCLTFLVCQLCMTFDMCNNLQRCCENPSRTRYKYITYTQLCLPTVGRYATITDVTIVVEGVMYIYTYMYKYLYMNMYMHEVIIVPSKSIPT